MPATVKEDPGREGIHMCPPYTSGDSNSVEAYSSNMSSQSTQRKHDFQAAAPRDIRNVHASESFRYPSKARQDMTDI